MGWIHDDVDILFKNVFSVPAVPKVDSEHAEIYRVKDIPITLFTAFTNALKTLIF